VDEGGKRKWEGKEEGEVLFIPLMSSRMRFYFDCYAVYTDDA
jgi:hypothetical protein